jgi:hypothetical protein
MQASKTDKQIKYIQSILFSFRLFLKILIVSLPPLYFSFHQSLLHRLVCLHIGMTKHFAYCVNISTT